MPLGLEPCVEGPHTGRNSTGRRPSADSCGFMPAHQTLVPVQRSHMRRARGTFRGSTARSGRSCVGLRTARPLCRVRMPGCRRTIQPGRAAVPVASRCWKSVLDEQRNDLVEHGEVVRLRRRSAHENADGDFVDISLRYSMLVLQVLSASCSGSPIAAEQENINRFTWFSFFRPNLCMCSSLGNSCRYSSATPLPA